MASSNGGVASLKPRLAVLESALGPESRAGDVSLPLAPRISAVGRILGIDVSGALAPQLAALEHALKAVAARLDVAEREATGTSANGSLDSLVARTGALDRELGCPGPSSEGLTSKVENICRAIVVNKDRLTALEEAVQGRSWVSGDVRSRVASLEKAVHHEISESLSLPDRILVLHRNVGVPPGRLQARLAALERDLCGHPADKACLQQRVAAVEVNVKGQAAHKSEGNLLARVESLELELRGRLNSGAQNVFGIDQSGPMLPRAIALESDMRRSIAWRGMPTKPCSPIGRWVCACGSQWPMDMEYCGRCGQRAVQLSLRRDAGAPQGSTFPRPSSVTALSSQRSPSQRNGRQVGFALGADQDSNSDARGFSPVLGRTTPTRGR
eukprot:TRINITY_DN44760_c0_g1_i1.p1 TRINITY_DN44760_c0_g1~~TRINITY_DN44760_c0_g1_i1.p1  ORF type:complete len:385 (+),score=46.74 TRINITY_DN44760_c0_g1_i1:146-1300(+)